MGYGGKNFVGKYCIRYYKNIASKKYVFHAEMYTNKMIILLSSLLLLFPLTPNNEIKLIVIKNDPAPSKR